MSVVGTIPTTSATIPPAVQRSGNGTLPAGWLRSFDGTTRTDFKMFAPVSYAMQALILAALADGIRLSTTGRFRSLARQEALFLERYQTEPIPGRPTKWWNGKLWYQKPGVAMAATPGTSNHGWGCADDICEVSEDGVLLSLRPPALEWLRDNAAGFGFALETRKEPWHWHWHRPGGLASVLTQRTVDVLHAVGVYVPNLDTFGFTVPAPTPPPAPPPTPPEEDDMTPEQDARLRAVEEAVAQIVAVVPKMDQTHTIMAGAFWPNQPDITNVLGGELALRIRRTEVKLDALAIKLGVATD